MRYARMGFSTEVLLGSRGISSKLLRQMLYLMPEDAKMIGFGYDGSRNVNYMFFSSDAFVDVRDGDMPHDIMPVFVRQSDGTYLCEKIDFGSAKDSTVPCLHSWSTHVGFLESYEYCKICDVRKS